ncbi:MAG: hybrid sensor histidine kinase/response regulator [Campylobacterota bacterium]
MVLNDMLLEQTKTLSLLYVESDEKVRLGMLDMLDLFFDKITVAVDGKEGIEKFLEGGFDLIITTIDMPNLDGIEMIEQIRKDDNNIPIIVSSTRNEPDYFTRTIMLGIDAYLLMPFQTNRFETVLQKVVDKIIIYHELLAYTHILEQKIAEQGNQIDRQNDYLAQQNRLANMGEMVNNIAHQWRQPLNRINSNIAVINTILSSDHMDLETVLSKIENIKKNTLYMSDTVEGCINFFHPGKRKTRFNIKDVLTKALDLIEPRLKNIDISFSCQEEIWVNSFEKEYQQVILTILHNAIDNFELKNIQNRAIQIFIESIDNSSRLRILDNGGGIHQDDIEEVFKPYFTTKFGKKGSGIGLYMSKMLVETSMGGELLTKNIDEGACFGIKLARGADEES